MSTIQESCNTHLLHLRPIFLLFYIASKVYFANLYTNVLGLSLGFCCCCMYICIYGPVNETAKSANIDLLGFGATFMKLLVLYKRLVIHYSLTVY